MIAMGTFGLIFRIGKSENFGWMVVPADRLVSRTMEVIPNDIIESERQIEKKTTTNLIGSSTTCVG